MAAEMPHHNESAQWKADHFGLSNPVETNAHREKRRFVLQFHIFSCQSKLTESNVLRRPCVNFREFRFTCLDEHRKINRVLGRFMHSFFQVLWRGRLAETLPVFYKEGR